MCHVDVRPSDERRDSQVCLDIAIKELKRKMKKEDIFQDMKRKEFYLSPSATRRFRKKEAIKRKKREERKHLWFENKV